MKSTARPKPNGHVETMQEGTVTVAGQRYELDKPLVLATQNPLNGGNLSASRSTTRVQIDRRLLRDPNNNDRRPNHQGLSGPRESHE